MGAGVNRHLTNSPLRPQVELSNNPAHVAIAQFQVICDVLNEPFIAVKVWIGPHES